MGQALDNHHATAEQDAMHRRQLVATIHVGHRRRFHAQQRHAAIHQPMGQIDVNPRQRVAIIGRAVKFVPIRSQQQAIAFADGVGG